MNDITTEHYFRCHLDTGPCEVNLRKSLMHQDNKADVFRVSVWRNNQPADLTGVTAYGFLYIAATRQTIPLQGVIDGSAAYSTPGYASLVIQLHQNEVRHTVLKVNFYIDLTGSDIILDPENRLPTVAELIELIEMLRNAETLLKGKLDANLGMQHAGKLLYVSADGSVQPLTLGTGLQIVNGVLLVNGGTSGGDDDEPYQPFYTVDGNLFYTADNLIFTVIGG